MPWNPLSRVGLKLEQNSFSNEKFCPTFLPYIRVRMFEQQITKFSLYFLIK